MFPSPFFCAYLCNVNQRKRRLARRKNLHFNNQETMKKNKKQSKVVRMDDAQKAAETAVMESEKLMADLMNVMGRHARVESPTLVAMMGLASVVAEVVTIQEHIGIKDAREKFLFLLASELTLRGLTAEN